VLLERNSKNSSNNSSNATQAPPVRYAIKLIKCELGTLLTNCDHLHYRAVMITCFWKQQLTYTC
jgi:hypothetical protein